MTGRCDACSMEFEPNIRTKKEGGVETTFFLCPRCQHEYVIIRTNPKLRKLQQQVENERSRLVKQRARGKFDLERLTRFQALTDELKAKMDGFNAKYTAHSGKGSRVDQDDIILPQGSAVVAKG